MSSNSRKRRNPFAEEQVKQAKVVKYDTETIQQKTLALLMGAQKNVQVKNNEHGLEKLSINAPVDSLSDLKQDLSFSPCVSCRKPTSHNNQCSFCKRISCNSCSVKCDLCLYLYCSFCSTPNYDRVYDRMFCLNCDEEQRHLSEDSEQVMDIDS